jgi:hypothetical protein
MPLSALANLAFEGFEFEPVPNPLLVCTELLPRIELSGKRHVL